MRKRVRHLGVSLGLLLAVAAAGAQEPGGVMGGMPPVQVQRRDAIGPTGTVTGRVVCADTQQAARFAQVMLVPVATDSSGRGFGGGGGGAARTDLDGTFTVSNVAVGDYYVTATATGYVTAGAQIQAAVNAGGDMASLLASLPTVHVAVGGASTANLSLQRGAVIAGRVVWDDSSAAAGVQISAVLQPPAATAGNTVASPTQRLPNGLGGYGGGFATTDDRGQFRMSGLAPGSYVVRVSLQTPMPGGGGGNFGRMSGILMYAPGKVRKADAKVYTVAQGEDRSDVMFTLDLRSLHSVSGRVSAVSGPSVQSGTVRLVDSVDSSLTRQGMIAADGSFVLTYVPAGTYTLSANGSTSAAANNGGRFPNRGGGGGGAGFQPFSETLSVTDTEVSGVAIELAPVSSTQ